MYRSISAAFRFFIQVCRSSRKGGRPVFSPGPCVSPGEEIKGWGINGLQKYSGVFTSGAAIGCQCCVSCQEKNFLLAYLKTDLQPDLEFINLMLFPYFHRRNGLVVVPVIAIVFFCLVKTMDNCHIKHRIFTET